MTNLCRIDATPLLAPRRFNCLPDSVCIKTESIPKDYARSPDRLEEQEVGQALRFQVLDGHVGKCRRQLTHGARDSA